MDAMTPGQIVAYAERTLAAARANAEAANAWAEQAGEVKEELAVALANLERARRALTEQTGRTLELEALVDKLEGQMEELEAELAAFEERCGDCTLEPDPEPPIVVPPPVEPPAGPGPQRWFQALDHADKTAAENKGLLEQVLQRASRKTQRSEWRGETYRAHEAPDLADLHIRPTWLWGVNVALGNDPNQKTGNVDVERCTFSPGPDTADFKAREQMKWGMRRYDLGDTYIGDCDFFDIPKEHGIYDSLAGHGYYRGCTFKNVGSQAIQLAYRDRPYQQYLADNDPFTKKPVIVIEDCHAVDTGRQGSRPSFAFTLFDPGTREKPGTVIVRDCSYVSDWATPRHYNGRELRSTGGLVVHQYQQVGDGEAATELVVVTNTLFDSTKGDRALVAIRGVDTTVFHDSTFTARDHPQPFVDIDDEAGANESGFVIIDNCRSLGRQPVQLRVRRKVVCSMHQPGRRVLVDVQKGEVFFEGPSQDEPRARIASPLAFKTGTIPSGITPQPVGHIDDMPEAG